MDEEREDFPDDPDESADGPLDHREAALIRRDLDDLGAFRDTFEPEGFKGVSVFCQDCVEEHFYGWDMLAQNLTALLESGETPVHEPAFDPRPEDYVDWEYARGYLDGLADAGGPMVPVGDERTPDCPHCGGRLPDGGGEVGFCPSCGADLAVARVARILADEGWSPESVSELLKRAGALPLRAWPQG